MRLLASGDALSFLSQSAPRPWIKRMLMWMIFNAEIRPYFRQGRIKSFTHFAFLIQHDGTVVSRGSSAFDRAVREKFSEDLAEQIISADATDPIYGDTTEWSTDDDPHEVSAGFFVFSDEIDWESGILRAFLSESDASDEHLFWDADQHLPSETFQSSEFDVELSGFCFSADDIEMLQPEKSLLPDVPMQSAKGGLLGRPVKWNWEGAMAHIVALANHPDGLPTGTGAQALIEKMIVDWFIGTTKDAPAISQIRTRAQTILRSVEKTKS